MRLRCQNHGVVADVGPTGRTVTMPPITYQVRSTLGGATCALLVEPNPQPGRMELHDATGRASGIACEIVEEG
ncbi:MAG TPA: hypothetical protein VGK74_22215 [Symbiobacteriaceae bacterium]|jgi:hypothetical protein